MKDQLTGLYLRVYVSDLKKLKAAAKTGGKSQANYIRATLGIREISEQGRPSAKKQAAKKGKAKPAAAKKPARTKRAATKFPQSQAPASPATVKDARKSENGKAGALVRKLSRPRIPKDVSSVTRSVAAVVAAKQGD